jgi:hypothetical protein
VTQQELSRLIELQVKNQTHRPPATLTAKEYAELEALQTKLSITEAEVADDPKTLFVDESRRPNLSDDEDYLAQVNAKITAERAAWIEAKVALLWERVEPVLEKVLLELATQAAHEIFKPR